MKKDKLLFIVLIIIILGGLYYLYVNKQRSNLKLNLSNQISVTNIPLPTPPLRPFLSCNEKGNLVECRLLKFPVKFSYFNSLKLDYHDKDLDQPGELSFPSEVKIINEGKVIMRIFPMMEGTDASMTPTQPFLVDGKQLEIGSNKVTKITTREDRGYIIFLQYPKSSSLFPALMISCVAEDQSSSRICDSIVTSIEFTP